MKKMQKKINSNLNCMSNKLMYKTSKISSMNNKLRRRNSLRKIKKGWRSYSLTKRPFRKEDLMMLKLRERLY